MRRPTDSGWRPSCGPSASGNACPRGLYQMTHERIKRAVPDEVRQFYWRGIANGVVVHDKLAHSENVLAKAPGNKFRASLLWLVESGR
jgi:hypothetical protein